MPAKKKAYNRAKSVRRLARARVGAVPGARVMLPKNKRKKPKHKERLAAQLES